MPIVMAGKAGEDIIIRVPVGTRVINVEGPGEGRDRRPPATRPGQPPLQAGARVRKLAVMLRA
jgi:GTPase involved in cell partitioning and DNA repair